MIVCPAQGTSNSRAPDLSIAMESGRDVNQGVTMARPSESRLGACTVTVSWLVRRNFKRAFSASIELVS